MRHVYFDKDFEFEENDLLDTARRRTVFREIVKDVRGGYQTDMNGALTRALEKAFRAGLELGRNNPDFEPGTRSTVPAKVKAASKVIDMMSIPPRSRDALVTISIMCGRSQFDEPSEWRKEVNPIVFRQIQPHPYDDKTVWQFVYPEYKRDDSFGPTTLAPLERLGILAMDPEDRYLILTARGLELLETGKTSLDTPAAPLWELKPKTPSADATPGI